MVLLNHQKEGTEEIVKELLHLKQNLVAVIAIPKKIALSKRKRTVPNKQMPQRIQGRKTMRGANKLHCPLYLAQLSEWHMTQKYLVKGHVILEK